MPAEWGFTEENRTQPIRGAALPMGFNRTPHYYQGLLLVGDAGGMVNPFNGEGIAYAMESGEILARTIAQALARARRTETERVLAGYPRALAQAYGGYYAAGPGVREGDRPARADAVRDPARHVPAGPDGLRGQAARQPDRSGGRCIRPAGQRPVQARP